MRAIAIIVLAAALSGCAGTMPAVRYPLEVATPAASDSTMVAAKVAAVMEANEITLPMVAAYLYNLGYVVHPSQLPRWHWSAPTTGSPVAYYAFELVGATGDTTLTHYLPQVVGTYRLRVRGVDAQQRVGPWTEIGWSDERGPGGALPGVAP